MTSAYVEHVALVSGFEAYVLGRILREEVRTGRLVRMRLSEDHQERVERSVHRLERAGEAWQREAEAEAISDDRKSQGPRSEMARGSKHADAKDGLVSAAEAAALLGCTDRRVRQLADELGGRRLSGRWQFPRAAVLAYRDRA